MELDTDRIVTFKTEVTEEEAKRFAQERLEHVKWELLQMNRELHLQPAYPTQPKEDKDYLADEEDFNKYFRDPKPN